MITLVDKNANSYFEMNKDDKMLDLTKESIAKIIADYLRDESEKSSESETSAMKKLSDESGISLRFLSDLKAGRANPSLDVMNQLFAATDREGKICKKG